MEKNINLYKDKAYSLHRQALNLKPKREAVLKYLEAISAINKAIKLNPKDAYCYRQKVFSLNKIAKLIKCNELYFISLQNIDVAILFDRKNIMNYRMKERILKKLSVDESEIVNFVN
jgi:tetratricopeptide (TPR) repeat protein